jgi:histidinol-phosphatase (PHP family)
MGGRFVLSDDSHSTEQVGLNYLRVLEAMKKAGIRQLQFYKPIEDTARDRHKPAEFGAISIEEIEALGFWQS